MESKFMQSKVKILIADDHPVFISGLKNVINANSELEVVGEAENGLIALKLIESLVPDIVILDINMPILDGIETAKRIFTEFPNIKTIFLAMEIDEDIIEKVKDLKIKGYLLKDNAIAEIINCIRYVAAGKMYMNPEILQLFIHTVENTSKKSKDLTLISKLTPTETRILRLLSKGKSNKEIAEELFISVHTCAKHRSNMCKKLQLSGNHSLLKFALKNNEF